MITSSQLTQFGAAAYTILTFHAGSGADVIARLCDAAPQGLDLDDKDQARYICAHYGLDPRTQGDSARVMFDQPAHANRAEIRAAALAWNDARTGDTDDDEHDAAAALIDTLMRHAGITLVTR